MKSHEIILVDDASPDNSVVIIRNLCDKNPEVKGILLSRNFGQHHAISAGLSFSSGRYVVVMDCDLQDIPEEIENLYRKASEGFDIVYASRVNRTDGVMKIFLSKAFYRILGYLTGTNQDASIANFGIYQRKTIEALMEMGDESRNFNTMIRWVGFTSTSIPVKHGRREEGASAYTLGKSFRLAFETIISFSDKPLRLVVAFGFITSLVSLVIGCYYLLLYLRGGITVLGYTSLILSMWFLSGLMIFVLGILGLYIGKTFDKVKSRPLFIIREKINIS